MSSDIPSGVSELHRWAKAMNEPKNSVAAHFYSAFIEEALYSLFSAKDIIDSYEAARSKDGIGSEHVDLTLCGVYLRHSFLLSTTALESAANGLISIVADGRQSVFRDLEMMATLTKFEVFAISRGGRIDRSSDKFEKVSKWIACRNAFVHPKPLRVGFSQDAGSSEIVLDTKKVGGRDYPIAYDFVDFRHAVWILGDVLAFVAWAVFDQCRLSIEEGSRAIGAGVTSHTGDALIAGEVFGFDLRSIGIDPSKHQVKIVKKKGPTKRYRQPR